MAEPPSPLRQSTIFAQYETFVRRVLPFRLRYALDLQLEHTSRHRPAVLSVDEIARTANQEQRHLFQLFFQHHDPGFRGNVDQAITASSNQPSHYSLDHQKQIRSTTYTVGIERE